MLCFAVLLKVLSSADVFHHISIMLSPSEPGQSPIQRLVMQELAEAQLVSKSTNCLVHVYCGHFELIQSPDFFLAGVAGADRSPKRVNGSATSAIKDASAGSGLRSRPDH